MCWPVGHWGHSGGKDKGPRAMVFAAHKVHAILLNKADVLRVQVQQHAGHTTVFIACSQIMFKKINSAERKDCRENAPTCSQRLPWVAGHWMKLSPFNAGLHLAVLSKRKVSEGEKW